MALPTNWVDGIGMVEDADFLNQVGAEVNANTNARPIYDTYAKMVNGTDYPAADHTEALYFCSDTDAVYRSNGTVWVKIRCGGVAGAWLTDVAAGTAFGTSPSLSSDMGERVLTLPASGSSLRGEYYALSPTSNFTITAVINPGPMLSDSAYSGILLRASGSGQAILFGVAQNGGLAGAGISVSHWTNSTTASNVSNEDAFPGEVMALQVVDNGTNHLFRYTLNGLDWIQLRSAGRTSFITADQYGHAGYNSTSREVAMRCRSLKIT